MIFLHPDFFWLTPLALFVGFAVARALRRNQTWRRDWGIPERPIHGLMPWSLGVAVFLMIAALARPVWDPKPVAATAQGQNTVFLVDVSRSMLTTDLPGGQSRLEAVKQALLDLIPDLRGDSVALVAFAGTTVTKCPLTTDLTFFGQATRLLEPGSTSRGGTLLGDALRRIKTDFIKKDKRVAIWIFTDGGDQESFPVEAARDLADSGTRLFIWGVGSLKGGQVPDQNVSSVLNEPLLKEVATTLPKGDYWGADTPLWQLNQAYRNHKETTTEVKTSQVVWEEGSWWLLWPILAFVFLSYPISLPKRKKIA